MPSVKDVCVYTQIEREDRKHCLVECPALHHVRVVFISKIKGVIIEKCGELSWTSVIENGKLESVLLGCTVLSESLLCDCTRSELIEIESFCLPAIPFPVFFSRVSTLWGRFTGYSKS